MSTMAALGFFSINSILVLIAYAAGALRYQRRAFFGAMLIGIGFALLLVAEKFLEYAIGSSPQQAGRYMGDGLLIAQWYLAGWALVSTIYARVNKACIGRG